MQATLTNPFVYSSSPPLQFPVSGLDLSPYVVKDPPAFESSSGSGSKNTPVPPSQPLSKLPPPPSPPSPPPPLSPPELGAEGQKGGAHHWGQQLQQRQRQQQQQQACHPSDLPYASVLEALLPLSSGAEAAPVSGGGVVPGDSTPQSCYDKAAVSGSWSGIDGPSFAKIKARPGGAHHESSSRSSGCNGEGGGGGGGESLYLTNGSYSGVSYVDFVRGNDDTGALPAAAAVEARENKSEKQPTSPLLSPLPPSSPLSSTATLIGAGSAVEKGGGEGGEYYAATGGGVSNNGRRPTASAGSSSGSYRDVIGKSSDGSLSGRTALSAAQRRTSTSNTDHNIAGAFIPSEGGAAYNGSPAVSGGVGEDAEAAGLAKASAGAGVASPGVMGANVRNETASHLLHALHFPCHSLYATCMHLTARLAVTADILGLI